MKNIFIITIISILVPLIVHAQLAEVWSISKSPMPSVVVDEVGNSIFVSRVKDVIAGHFNIHIERYNNEGIFQWEYEINIGTNTWS